MGYHATANVPAYGPQNSEDDKEERKHRPQEAVGSEGVLLRAQSKKPQQADKSHRHNKRLNTCPPPCQLRCPCELRTPDLTGLRSVHQLLDQLLLDPVRQVLVFVRPERIDADTKDLLGKMPFLTFFLRLLLGAHASGSLLFESLYLERLLTLDELVEDARLTGSVATGKCDVLVPRVRHSCVKPGHVGLVVIVYVLWRKRSQLDIRHSVSTFRWA